MVNSLDIREAIDRIMATSISSAVLLLLLVTLPVKCVPSSGKLHGNAHELQKNEELFMELRSLLSSAQKQRGLTRTNNKFLNLSENQSSVEQTNGDFGPLDSPQLSKLTPSNAGTKRQLKFNPTGWRKKRSTDEYYNSPLGNIWQEKEHDEEREHSDEKEFNLLPISTNLLKRLLLKPVMIRRNSNNAGQSMDRLGDILAHLRSYLAKRKSGKPLDFNPTGW